MTVTAVTAAAVTAAAVIQAPHIRSCPPPNTVVGGRMNPEGSRTRTVPGAAA
ncbi:MAG: hypothetical protein JWR28_2197 [Modestobacter sp.]|nr:hypothetical protein [Modestobacter sp.]MCW2619048.1 hypothetical protein [Modestobacter sp.]